MNEVEVQVRIPIFNLDVPRFSVPPFRVTAPTVPEPPRDAPVSTEIGELSSELLELLKQAERSVANRFPRVAARFGMREVRRLAQAFVQQGAPFPIG